MIGRDVVCKRAIFLFEPAWCEVQLFKGKKYRDAHVAKCISLSRHFLPKRYARIPCEFALGFGTPL